MYIHCIHLRTKEEEEGQSCSVPDFMHFMPQISHHRHSVSNATILTVEMCTKQCIGRSNKRSFFLLSSEGGIDTETVQINAPSSNQLASSFSSRELRDDPRQGYALTNLRSYSYKLRFAQSSVSHPVLWCCAVLWWCCCCFHPSEQSFISFFLS